MGRWHKRKQSIEQMCIASNREGIAEFAIPIGDDLRTILSALGKTELASEEPEPERRSMSVQNDKQDLWSQDEAHSGEHAFHEQGSEFVLIEEGKPPSLIELARERMLISRLYLGLLRTITDDYGTEFAAQSDSLTYRTIGIYVFLRTVMCSPVRASQIAHALKLPRATVLRRLQELTKDRYVERVGNAYRVTDKVNIPDLRSKLQRRIDMVTETAKRLSGLHSSPPIAP
jgi:hypothetical protein